MTAPQNFPLRQYNQVTLEKAQLTQGGEIGKEVEEVGEDLAYRRKREKSR